MLTQIIKLNVVDSTQNLAKQMALDGAPGGTLIVTATQSAGRGQFLRMWNSQEGGLYFSLLLRPEKQIAYSPSLSLKVAGVVADTLKKHFKVKTKIKHPNDVLVYNPKKKKWQKVCGILIESSSYDVGVEWLAIGVGVNLNNKIAKELPDACSISTLLRRKVDMDAFLTVLLKEFCLRYHDWLNSSI